MYKPKKGSLRDRVCRLILNRNEVTAQECIELFGERRQSHVKCALSQLKCHGALREDNGLYRLANHIKRHYGVDVLEEEKLEVKTPARTFKALSTKNMPCLNPLIKDRLRETHYIVCSSAVPVTYDY